MTEARLKELQELNACKSQLDLIHRNLNVPGVEIRIVTGMSDIEYGEMHVRLYPGFYEDFKQFISTQYTKHKEAFDNA